MRARAQDGFKKLIYLLFVSLGITSGVAFADQAPAKLSQRALGLTPVTQAETELFKQTMERRRSSQSVRDSDSNRLSDRSDDHSLSIQRPDAVQFNIAGTRGLAPLPLSALFP